MPTISDFIQLKTSEGNIPVATIVRCYEEGDYAGDAVDETTSSSVNGGFSLTTVNSNPHTLHILGYTIGGFSSEIEIIKGVIPV